MKDHDSAAWAANHARWSDTVGAAIHQLAAAFARLQRRQFEAPWRSPRVRASSSRT